MFDFLRTKAPTQHKKNLETILAQHAANLAAERGPAARIDVPPPVAKKKAGFGKRN